MKCRQCGNELEKKNKKCPHCEYVNSLESRLIPKELKHLSKSQLQKHLNRQNRISQHRHYIIIAIVLIVIASCTIHFVTNTKQAGTIPNFHDDLIENKTSNATGNSVPNIVNGGLLLQYGTDVYTSDKEGISKISLTLNNKELISKDYATYLNMSDNGFYYINKADNVISFYDINEKTTTRLNIQATQLESVGNYLYYLEATNTRAIYQLNKDTLESKKMTQSECTQFKIAGDWLYFSTDTSFYQMPILGGEIMKLSDEPYRHFTIDKQNIYYLDTTTNFIQTVKKDGSEKNVVVDREASCFLLTDHYLFYAKKDGGLVKVIRETGESSLITQEKTNQLHIAGTWIYYLTDHEDGRFVSIDENSETITPVDVINTNE